MRKSIWFLTFCVSMLLACTTNTNKQKKEKSEEQIERERSDKELAQLDEMMKDSEAGYKHEKKHNPDPSIIVKSYKFKKGNLFNTLQIKVQNKTPYDISYFQLSWKLFDDKGNEMPKPYNEVGTSSEIITQWATGTLEYEVEGKLPKYAVFRLDTVRLGDFVWEYDKSPLVFKN